MNEHENIHRLTNKRQVEIKNQMWLLEQLGTLIHHRMMYTRIHSTLRITD